MPTRNLVSCDQKMRKQKTDCFFLLQFSSFVGANFVIVTSRKFGDFNSLMCGVACGFRWFPCGVTGGFFFSFYRALFGLLLTLVVCVCVRVLSICVTLWVCERKQQVYCRAARFIFQFLSVFFAWQTQTTVSIRLDDSLGVCGLCMYVSTRGTNCYCCLLLVEEKE